MALMRTQAACLMSAGVLLWCGRLQHGAILYHDMDMDMDMDKDMDKDGNRLNAMLLSVMNTKGRHCISGEHNAGDEQGGRLQHEAMLYWCAHFKASVSHEHKGQALQCILWELDAGNIQG